IADWAVCLHAAHPGYIGWEEFMANQRRMADNVTCYEAGHAGVPRKGSALLQGIAICGLCGRRMSLRYTGPNGDYPVYCCRSDRDQQGSAICQEVRAFPVDTLVERALLDALAPDQIGIALAADRKRILRFIVREVVLDQKRAPGQVWLKVVWQTGAISEHRVQRRVRGYHDYVDCDRLRQRIAALNAAGKMDKEIGTILNRE